MPDKTIKLHVMVDKPEGGKQEIEVETSAWELSKHLSDEQFKELFSDWLNKFKDFQNGERIGTLFHDEHRTIQGSVYRFCLGLLVALGNQKYFDARNEVAVTNCQKIARMLETGELKKGWMI